MSTAVAERPPTLPSGEPQELTHRQILEVMTGLLAALFTALISSTIVSTALPTIMADLHGTQRQYTWVITASLLAMTISTPIWGKLSDLFNKKLLVQLAIILFVAGSIGAGFSQTVAPMMIFRAVQGLAMGGLTALVQSIMGTLIAPRNRGRYAGYMGAVMAVATVSGPLLGGVITDNLNWRWCFYVCVPLAVIALILLQATLRLPPVQKRKVKIDYLGGFLLAVAAALPMLWVTFAGQDYDWISWESAGFLAAFLVAGGLAVLVELKASEPMVPIRVMRNNTTALMIVASIAVGVGMFSGSVFLTQYFQLAGDHSPTRAGLMTIPLIAAQMLSSTIGGQIVTRTGRWKPLMVIGSILLVIGLGALGLIDHTTPYWQVAIAMGVMGVGMGTLIQNIVLAVQNTVDVKDIGASSATISFFRSLGGAVGVSVLGAVLANQVEDNVATGLAKMGIKGGAGGDGSLDIKNLPAPIQQLMHEAYGDAFGTVFMIAAAASIVTMLAIFFVKETTLRTTVAMHAPPKPLADTAGAEIDGGNDPAPELQAEHRAAVQAEPLATNGEKRDVVSQFDPRQLDDPSERLAVSALDVLTAAQDQSRQNDNASREALEQVASRLDSVTHDVDAALGHLHREIDAIRSDLLSAKEGNGASLGRDGVGGDPLRQYEYGLLLSSQQTADRVTKVARDEAQHKLGEAERQIEVLEKRIAQLRSVEQDLSHQVSERLTAPPEKSGE